MSDKLNPDTIAWLNEHCNRLLYGQCWTGRCLKRGGYSPKSSLADGVRPSVNCDIATCEPYEISLRIKEIEDDS